MIYNLFFKQLALPAVDKVMGTKIGIYLTELDKSQWLSTNALIDLQEKKLRDLIEHAYVNVPFYSRIMRERGLLPHDIQHIADLHKLPILTRELVHSHRKELITNDISSRKFRIKSTGGTTGQPLQYYVDWDAWSHITACRYRGQGFSGFKTGDKFATIAGSSLIPNINPSLRERFRILIERNLPLSAVRLTTDIMENHTKKLIRFKPKFLVGYPTALYILANYIKHANKSIPAIKGIFTTAEVLQPSHRETIENVFECQVYDAYGCGDGGIIATECKQHNGLHIAMEHAILEFVDSNSNPIQTGRGTILATDLFNYTQPFIRYQVGDICTLSSEKCLCGRGLVLITSIEGRRTDILTFSNGVTLSGPAATLMFRDSTFLQYQLIQEDASTLVVNICKDDKTKNSDIDKTKQLLISHLGNEIQIIINIVDEIPPTKSGKQRFIISNMDSQETHSIL